jgi:hypothetical protein
VGAVLFQVRFGLRDPGARHHDARRRNDSPSLRLHTASRERTGSQGRRRGGRSFETS